MAFVTPYNWPPTDEAYTVPGAWVRADEPDPPYMRGRVVPVAYDPKPLPPVAPRKRAGAWRQPKPRNRSGRSR